MSSSQSSGTSAKPAASRAAPLTKEDLQALNIIIPNDMRGLRACMFCSLVKSAAQFESAGCDNCTFLDMAHDRNRVIRCTSASFDGLVALVQPPESWVAKWQRLGQFHRGCYALKVNGTIPDEILHELQKHNIRYKPRVQV